MILLGSINCTVNVSDKNTAPAIAAKTGTHNCTMAACVLFNSGIATYQILYPTPDAMAPEAIASNAPSIRIFLSWLIPTTIKIGSTNKLRIKLI